MGKTDRFKRSKSRSKPEKPLILLIVTGDNEERYFRERNKEKRYSSIDLRNSGGDANPGKVIEKYKNEKYDPPFGKSVCFDSIWFHFDYDNEPDITKKQRQPHKDGNFNRCCDRLVEITDDKGNQEWKVESARKSYRVVYTNPSFELWILLHFEYLDGFINRTEAFRAVKRHVSGYDKGKLFDSYSFVKDNESVAIENAKKLEKHQNDIEHYNFHERTPSSTLFFLLEELDSEFG